MKIIDPAGQEHIMNIKVEPLRFKFFGKRNIVWSNINTCNIVAL
jgi:hypothetical protein